MHPGLGSEVGRVLLVQGAAVTTWGPGLFREKEIRGKRTKGKDFFATKKEGAGSFPLKNKEWSKSEISDFGHFLEFGILIWHDIAYHESKEHFEG